MAVHPSLTAFVAFGILIVTVPCALPEEINGVPGAPGATTTIDEKQPPPPDPKFGGIIEQKASGSKAWWAPRVVPPKGAPNVLLIMTDDAGIAAPSILNKSYTITAEVEIPDGGAEGMIVTDGGRFGGYGLFLSKGEFGIGRSRPVFLYNLLDLKRTTWEGPELAAGKYTIVFDFKSDGRGLGKGGTGVLSVNGKEVARNTLEHETPITFPEDESFDIGQDTRTSVALLEYRYETPFKFTGTIKKLTFELAPEPKADANP